METDCRTALANSHDAIGIRVICSFVEEVYRIERWLQKREDIEILEKKIISLIRRQMVTGVFI